jgi:hypothetical protein
VIEPIQELSIEQSRCSNKVLSVCSFLSPPFEISQNYQTRDRDEIYTLIHAR